MIFNLVSLACSQLIDLKDISDMIYHIYLSIIRTNLIYLFSNRPSFKEDSHLRVITLIEYNDIDISYCDRVHWCKDDKNIYDRDKKITTIIYVYYTRTTSLNETRYHGRYDLCYECITSNIHFSIDS